MGNRANLCEAVLWDMLYPKMQMFFNNQFILIKLPYIFFVEMPYRLFLITFTMCFAFLPFIWWYLILPFNLAPKLSALYLEIWAECYESAEEVRELSQGNGKTWHLNNLVTLKWKKNCCAFFPGKMLSAFVLLEGCRLEHQTLDHDLGGTCLSLLMCFNGLICISCSCLFGMYTFKHWLKIWTIFFYISQWLVKNR